MADPEWKPNWEDYDDDEQPNNDDAKLSPKPPKRARRSTSPLPPPRPRRPDTTGIPADGNGDAAPICLLKPGEIEGIANPPLKIASFNIQVFGERKMDKVKVTETLMKILQRYDIVLVLEIRDSSETAFPELVKECNKLSLKNPFSSVVSARLGRTSSKEQYGFMYRVRKVEVKSTYQFDDGVDDGTDVFQREPFAVRFYSPTTELEDFAIIATHTEPDEAVKEIGALHKVYDSAKKHWGGLEDILIAGDFNADEGYVNRDDWLKIRLRHDKRFKWLICDSTDTTTSNTDRAYDRFVVAGEKLTKCVVPGKSTVFKFDTKYGLTYDEARAVSDHYPIEMELSGKVNDEAQAKLMSCVSATITQKTPVKRESDVRRIYRAEPGPASAHFSSHVNYDDSRMLEVVAKRENVDNVMQALADFQDAFPNVIEDATIDMVRAYIEGSTLFNSSHGYDHPYVYGLACNVALAEAGSTVNKRGAQDVTVSTRLQDPLTCSVTVSLHMT